jgi:hypothetical protein
MSPPGKACPARDPDRRLNFSPLTKREKCGVAVLSRAAVALLCLLAANVALAGPRVDVVVGGDAPELEKFAAQELAGQFQRLFDANVRIDSKVPEGADGLIYVGSPATNPAIQALRMEWP